MSRCHRAQHAKSLKGDDGKGHPRTRVMVVTHSPYFFTLLPVLSSVVHGHSVELGVGLSREETAMLCCKSIFLLGGVCVVQAPTLEVGFGGHIA